jgi:hypothetical protein
MRLTTLESLSNFLVNWPEILKRQQHLKRQQQFLAGAFLAPARKSANVDFQG